MRIALYHRRKFADLNRPLYQSDTTTDHVLTIDLIDRAFVNFYNEHGCKNYDTIKRKAMQLQVAKDEELIVRLQDGDIRLAEMP